MQQERMKMKRKNATLTLMITYGSDPNRTGGSSKAIISTIVAIQYVREVWTFRHRANIQLFEFVQLSIIRCSAE
jgi:hypothetical protein